MSTAPTRNVVFAFPRLQPRAGDQLLGIGYISSALKTRLPDVGVHVFDTTFRNFASVQRHWSAFIEAHEPMAIGVFVDTATFHQAIALARLARARGCFVVFGGPHATVLPETLLPHGDVVLRGEAEESFPRLVEALDRRDFSEIPGATYSRDGEIVRNPAGRFIEDLDALPFPDRRIYDMRSYLAAFPYMDCLDPSIEGATMITSRGCPFRCTYCQPTLREIFGTRIRRRSQENVVAEMRDLKKTYGISAIFFHDDTFTVDRGWVSGFSRLARTATRDLVWGCNSRLDTLDEAMMREMHEAGCRSFHLGIESGSERILFEVYEKNIRLEQIRRNVAAAKRVGIHLMGFFMIGAPTETREEIALTAKLARSLPLDEATFSIVTPIPKTTLHDRMAHDRAYVLDSDFSRYDYYKRRSFVGDGLSAGRLWVIQRAALFRFYGGPKRWAYLSKQIRSRRGIQKLYRKVRRFI